MPLLVIGTGRCGTGFISKLLSEAGAEVGHEWMGADGTADWRQTFHSHCREWSIVQQVRSPLPTVGSLQTMSLASVAVANSHMSLPEKRLERSMLWYVKVNLIAQQKALFAYQVEAVDEVWDRLCELTAIPGRPMPEVPTNINTRHLSYTMPTWDELDKCNEKLAKRVRELGRSYGYEV